MKNKNIKTKTISKWWQPIDRFLHEGFAEEETTLYKIINDIIVFLIIYSIVTIVLSSVQSIEEKYANFFSISEAFVVGIFTFEYLANIYVAKKKSKYILGPWGIIDILAIVPSYLTLIDLRILKIFRIFRVLRFLRMMRMIRLIKLAKNASGSYEARTNKFDTLKMDLQIYFIALFSVIIVFSTLVYYAERVVTEIEVNGTAELINVVDPVTGNPVSAFTSIPKAMWWCITTITTVGYGDMYPITVIGRLIASVTMLTGLALFGMLMNVIGKSMMSSLFGSSNLDEVDIKEAEELIEKTQ